MAQDYGAANPIADVFKRGYRAVTGTLDRVPDPPFTKRPDTSWHDEMVRAANRSFQQRAATPPAKKRAPARPAAKRR